MKTIIICLLMAVFGFSSCEYSNTQSPDKQGKEDVLDQCKCEKNEVDPFVHNLQGNWITDSYFYYDKEWKEVESTLILNGTPYLEGISSAYYTFNSDGTLTYTLEIEGYPNETVEYNSHCFYDSEKKILTLKNCEGIIIKEYAISGYDGESLTLDYTEHAYDSYTDEHTYKYVREILKKRQE